MPCKKLPGGTICKTTEISAFHDRGGQLFTSLVYSWLIETEGRANKAMRARDGDAAPGKTDLAGRHGTIC